MVEKKSKSKKMLSFDEAFKYPFNRMKGMLNILWIFLPILGWFALGGYGVRIVGEFLNGKFEKLPLFSFKEDMKLGFFMFIKSLPFWLGYIIVFAILGAISEMFELLSILLEIFILPILTINFFKKQTVESYFEFKVIQYVFDNIGDYLMTLLKGIALGIIFLIMCLVLVGFPALMFTGYIFIADFYRRRVKSSN